ncbi:hypothetical protein [Paenibacillus sp. L3-i20]|uniref:hypothetical protein n=1 Tax=Paenibacillus sp. L3-i20 TaxID=2905833 RepID=UPI001EDCAA66|nr:hypothetical protein [Paenibacillus sp. L3-i20]GKU79274.1 hypothetical protein L3i20_v236710 [Paenibacillus sp. L3-i20]
MSLRLKIVTGCKHVKGIDVYIDKGRNPGYLKFKTGLFTSTTLPIAGLDWQAAATRSAGKAAAGAIIGGALTGGLGLLAGAAIGGRKKDASTAVFTFHDGQRLYVTATGKDFEKLQSWL